jgi:hypothetical protein
MVLKRFYHESIFTHGLCLRESNIIKLMKVNVLEVG